MFTIPSFMGRNNGVLDHFLWKYNCEGNIQSSGVNQKKQLCEEPLQAMRRSFSMDSSSHRLCIDFHEHDQEMHSASAGSSNMMKMSFLFFGNNRGRSNAILPLWSEQLPNLLVLMWDPWTEVIRSVFCEILCENRYCFLRGVKLFSIEKCFFLALLGV